MKRVRLGQGQLKEHGRYIYAYCNIRTKQVVYSLSQSVNVCSPAYPGAA